MADITPLGERIIRELARYKYLSADQLVNLGVSVSAESIKRELRTLRRLKCTDKFTSTDLVENGEPGVTTRVRSKDLHYITAKGANFLDEETELRIVNIRYSKRQRLNLSNDYPHRVSTINMHISYDRWIKNNSYHHVETLLYYDKRAKFKDLKYTIETRYKSSNGTYTPDAVMGYADSAGQPQLFILEVYNGARKKYAHEQLKELFELIEESAGQIGKRIGVKQIPRVLVTCDTPKRLGRLIEVLKGDDFFDFEGIEDLLFFKYDAEVWEEFGKDWVNIDGDIIQLEQLAPVQLEGSKNL